MKQYIEIAASRFAIERGVVLPDGRIVSIYRQDGTMQRYDQAFNLETGELYPMGEAPAGSVTLNSLAQQYGRLQEVQCYDECEYNLNKYPSEISITKDFVKEIQQHFSEHGYKVTQNAIRYCLDNWQADSKSGYRDDVNGYHLFSPCGCNPLSLRLSTLDDRLDWQTTYYC